MNWLEIFNATHEELTEKYPCLRRFVANGFVHDAVHDRVEERQLCFRSPNQTLLIDPVSGDFQPVMSFA